MTSPPPPVGKLSYAQAAQLLKEQRVIEAAERAEKIGGAASGDDLGGMPTIASVMTSSLGIKGGGVGGKKDAKETYGASNDSRERKGK